MVLAKLSPSFPFQIGVPTLEGFVDQNDIVSDPLNALPGDIKLLSPAKQSKEPAGTVNHNGNDLSLRNSDIHVRHKAQTTTVTDVDDLFAS